MKKIKPARGDRAKSLQGVPATNLSKAHPAALAAQTKSMLPPTSDPQPDTQSPDSLSDLME